MDDESSKFLPNFYRVPRIETAAYPTLVTFRGLFGNHPTGYFGRTVALDRVQFGTKSAAKSVRKR